MLYLNVKPVLHNKSGQRQHQVWVGGQSEAGSDLAALLETVKAWKVLRFVHVDLKITTKTRQAFFCLLHFSQVKF